MQGSQEQERMKAKGMYHDVTVRLVKLLNILMAAVPFACCWFMYYAQRVVMTPSMFRSAVMVLLFMGLYLFFGRVYDAFCLSIKRLGDLFISQVLGIIMADGVMFIALWLMSGGFPDLLPALLALVGQAAMSLLWCFVAHHWYFARFKGQKTVIVCGRQKGLENVIGQYGLNKKFDVRLSCTVEECMANDLAALQGMEAVFLCGVHSHDRNIILKYCVNHNIHVYVIPRVGDVIMSGAQRIHMCHLPMLSVGRYNPPPEFVLLKRVFDVVASAAAILITSPLMLIVAIAVKAQDGGPIFYRQTRLTKDGREFKIMKFRSMRVDAEKDGVARLSTGEKDDRITPVGHVIRACRLDELPQLFNILAGSMSIVGPRPERPEIARQYEQEMPEFSLRLQAKAGLTGYAQVYGKYNTTPYAKLQMDLMYIANPSIVEDIKIMFATIRILFDKESTEGIAGDAVTAASYESIDETDPEILEEKVLSAKGKSVDAR